MTPRPVSVVVVSRDRPDALKRCLTGLSQQLYPNFEIVVVADPLGFDATADLAFSGHLKTCAFDAASISAARNAGIAAAAGEVVAFIDDDAVAEPTWLTHLIAPFDQPQVAAAGGFVLGRNGISYQWKARSVDGLGDTADLDVHATLPTVLTPAEGRAIKTEGTNMAVRREVLAEMGGFDPAFRFYLDETDLNLRLARIGHATAIVPRALVHHGFLPSTRRAADRTATDLFEIGASFAVFLRKHAPQEAHAAALADFAGHQKRRAIGAMVSGRLDPGRVRGVMKSLARGLDEGRSRTFHTLPPLVRAADGFRAFPGRAGAKSDVFAGRPTSHKARMDAARAHVEAGGIATVLTLSPTALYHHVRYSDDGIWVQRGGVFGRAERHQPLFRLTGFAKRRRTEVARVADVRNLNDM